MKKILLFLLLSIAGYGQIVPTGQEQDFDYGIKNTASQLDDNAAFITVQDATGVQGKSTSSVWAKKIYVDNADATKSFLSTGLIKNGLVTTNADPTKFNITAGIGIITNFDNPEIPTSTIVSFPAFTGITPTYLTTGNITYVAITLSGGVPVVLMQATAFDNVQRRNVIALGAVIHSNLSTINLVNNISAPTNAGTNQLHDLYEFIGALNLTGNKYTANGANLSLDKTAGTIGKLGVNFANNWRDPNRLSIGLQTLLTFRYRTQNGTESGDLTVLNPAVYDLANVLTAVPSNKFSIQTVTLFQTGMTRIQYGQSVYNTLAEAEAAILTRSYVVESNIAMNGIARAYIILKNTATSLQNASDAKIIEAQKFGGIVSGGAAVTDSAIIAALGYTPENVANKSDSYTSSSSTTYASTKAVVDGLSNKIGGTGTANYISKFTASGAVGNSTVYDNGTNIGIGTTNPVAKLHVGNGTANNSGDSQILISRLVDNSVSGNGHAFSDSSNITRDGTIGYNSFDARVSFSGTANFDHYAGFQYAPAFDSSGVITNSYGFYATNPSGTGVLVNNYGLYVAPLTKGTNNYAVYTQGTTPVYFGGNVGIGSGSPGLGSSIRAITIENSELNYGTIQFHVKSDDFVPDIDIDGVGWFIGSASPTKVASVSGVSANFTENSAHLSFKTANLGSLNEIMRITDIGKIGIDTTTPSAKLVVNSGELLVNTNVNNGVDKLQVNGTISATGYTGGATLTGTPTAPTATVGTNTTQIATTAFVQTSTASVASAVYGSDVSLSSGQSPYTLQLSDANARLTTNGTFNQNYSIVIPTNASVPFQIGTKIRINCSANQPGFVTLSGGGVTFEGLNLSTPTIRHRSSFIITKIAIDTWYIDELSLWITDTSGNLVQNTDKAVSGNFTGSFIGSLNSSKFPSYTVATLPTSSPLAVIGNMAYVTDALAPTYMATVVGGGAVVTPVFYNGVNWVAH